MSHRRALVLAPLAAALLTTLPVVAGAQGAQGPPAAPAPPAPGAPGAPASALPAPPPVALARLGTQLAPGRWTYSARASMNGQSQDVGTRVLTLSRRTPGWLVLLEERNPMASSTDSLFLRGDLTAERRALRAQTQQGPATLALAFSADSIVGSFQAGGQTQALRVGNPRQAVASDGVIMLALSKLPLAAGWSGSMDLLNPQNGGVIPLAMRVVRSESVTVKAGTFDAWVVEASAGPSQTTFWVARGGPVVRVVATLPQAPGARIETTLDAM